MDEEDCYAEILKNDIIKLDEESALTTQETHARFQDPPQTHAFQGTAQRRIRLKVNKPRPRSAASGLGFPSSKRPSKSTITTLFGTLTNRILLCVFFVLTLIALYLSFMGLGSVTPVTNTGRIGSL